MLLALTMVLTLCLTGCGDSGGGGERTVNVCGWGENIDPELIDRFEQETGIQVNYQTAESNETMYALIKQGGTDYDVIVPSDYMIGQMIAEGAVLRSGNTTIWMRPWGRPLIWIKGWLRSR